ncbi:MAG: 4Fe-4S binding protein [Vicinamibacteria bacterium]|nr:4Fe-4S binding protein [Vicinamibacteria bacterium]
MAHSSDALSANGRRRVIGVDSNASVQCSSKDEEPREGRESSNDGFVPANVSPVVAVVDDSLCRGCGVCERVCPDGAITIDNVAYVDGSRCRGCGRCVPVCPLGAIVLRSLNE